MIIQHPLVPAGYKQITLTGAVSIIVPPPNAVHVIIQPSGDIRIRDDGKSPSSSTGIKVANAATFELASASRELLIYGANGVVVDLLWHSEI